VIKQRWLESVIEVPKNQRFIQKSQGMPVESIFLKIDLFL